MKLKKPNRMMKVFWTGVVTLLIMVGCSSDGGNEASGDPVESNETNTETLYQEADEVVLEYTKAHYEYDIPVLFDLAPPKLQEEYLNEEKTFFYFREFENGVDMYSDVPIEDLIKPDQFEEIKAEYNNADYNEKHETFFQDFSDAEDKLYVVRFNHLYEQKGELAYFVKPWMEEVDDPNAGGKQRTEGSGYLKVKQDNDGEWKVIGTTSGQFREEGINTSDRNEIKAKGTVVHEREKEDDYGF